MSAYQTLEQRFARLAALEGAAGILGWDAQTLMPDGAAEARGDQLAILRGLAHEMLTAPATAEDLDAAEQTGGLDPWPAANLREMRRAQAHAMAVPRDLVEASSRAVSRSEMVWREARRERDFAGWNRISPRCCDSSGRSGRRRARPSGSIPTTRCSTATIPACAGPRSTRSSRSDGWLPELIARARELQQAAPAPLPLDGPFDVAVQRDLGLKLMEAVGFDFTRGRLDISLHPFCGGATDDVRITTRYDAADFGRALMGVLHETGHALYEQGRPASWRNQPVGAARGMSLHESQSLIVEMQACRSRPFFTFLAPLLREAFGRSGPEWSPENLHALNTRVAPGFIRVDADEATYPAHILLRYRLETAMIAGDLAVRDLPGAFNDGLRDLLGLAVPDDRVGCLQDIHWPSGAFGYFPTYTLGALAAAQLFRAARASDPALPDCLAQGDFAPLRTWLRANVHEVGSLLDTDALLTRATGAPLGTDAFRAHLEARYLGA